METTLNPRAQADQEGKEEKGWQFHHVLFVVHSQEQTTTSTMAITWWTDSI
jgi:hypothetical protein